VLDKLKRVGERLLEDLKDYRDWAPRGTMTCPATEQ